MKKNEMEHLRTEIKARQPWETPRIEAASVALSTAKEPAAGEDETGSLKAGS